MISPLFLLSTLTLMLPVTHAHKILLYPWSQGFNSHVLDFITMAGFLQEAGHDVHFLCADSAIAPIEKRGFKTHHFRSPNIIPQSQTWQEVFLNPGVGHLNLILQMSDSELQYCQNLLENLPLRNLLKAAEYDLLIYDLAEECGNLVANIFKLPTMIYSPVGYVSSIPGGFPHFPSFVPTIISPYSGHMTFKERVSNVLIDAILKVIGQLFLERPMARLASKYNTSYDPWISVNSIILCRSHSSLDFPRPTLPNVIDIGDAFFQPAKALTPELDAFMESAGPQGVIVVSFGTLLATLPDSLAVVYSRVFGRLPQKVVWRYKGHLPELGKNTMLVDWLPQNDLLGHKQTRLFVTHCGMSSTFEAAGHGVPVVAVPIFGDQNQNAAKLTQRAGMGRMVDFHTITESKLHDAITDVLADPRYGNNALQTSLLLRDQPIPARSRVLWYADHVVRHKGARHLVADSLKELNTLQLYSIDVYASLALCVGTTLVVLYYVGTKLFRTLLTILRNGKQHKD